MLATIVVALFITFASCEILVQDSLTNTVSSDWSQQWYHKGNYCPNSLCLGASFNTPASTSIALKKKHQLARISIRVKPNGSTYCRVWYQKDDQGGVVATQAYLTTTSPFTTLTVDIPVHDVTNLVITLDSSNSNFVCFWNDFQLESIPAKVILSDSLVDAEKTNWQCNNYGGFSMCDMHVVSSTLCPNDYACAATQMQANMQKDVALNSKYTQLRLFVDVNSRNYATCELSYSKDSAQQISVSVGIGLTTLSSIVDATGVNTLAITLSTDETNGVRSCVWNNVILMELTSSFSPSVDPTRSPSTDPSVSPTDHPSSSLPTTSLAIPIPDESTTDISSSNMVNGDDDDDDDDDDEKEKRGNGLTSSTETSKKDESNTSVNQNADFDTAQSDDDNMAITINTIIIIIGFISLICLVLGCEYYRERKANALANELKRAFAEGFAKQNKERKASKAKNHGSHHIAMVDYVNNPGEVNETKISDSRSFEEMFDTAPTKAEK